MFLCALWLTVEACLVYLKYCVPWYKTNEMLYHLRIYNLDWLRILSRLVSYFGWLNIFFRLGEYLI